MNRQQKLLHAVAGFFIGNIILAALLLGFSNTRNYQYFNASGIERLRQIEVREANVKAEQIEVRNVADSDLLVRLFQILFWLFLISPPIIVVLLLVIISKMNRKNSLE